MAMTHECIGRFLAGITTMISLTLGHFLSPWWLLATAGVAANLVLSALIDCCPVKRLLIRMGVPGERDLGRAEAIEEAAAKLLPARRTFRHSRTEHMVRRRQDLN